MLAVYCVLALLAALAGGALPTLFRLTHTPLQMAVIFFVAGPMLGLSLLGLLPHASHELNSIHRGTAWLLAGLCIAVFISPLGYPEHEPMSLPPEPASQAGH
jgi:zinc transporter ZupT